MVDSTFCKSTIDKTNCILLLCNVHVRSSHRRCSVKEMFLRILQNSQEGTCARVSFLIKLQVWGLQLYWKRDSGTGVFRWILQNFLKKPLLTEHFRWLLLAFQSESTHYSFRTSYSKQLQYLKFTWTITSWEYSSSNIAQTSSLCYVAGF